MGEKWVRVIERRSAAEAVNRGKDVLATDVLVQCFKIRSRDAKRTRQTLQRVFEYDGCSYFLRLEDKEHLLGFPRIRLSLSRYFRLKQKDFEKPAPSLSYLPCVLASSDMKKQKNRICKQCPALSIACRLQHLVMRRMSQPRVANRPSPLSFFLFFLLLLFTDTLSAWSYKLIRY